MMRTPIDIDLLTGQQLEALHILNDGEWRDRTYIHNKIGFKKFDYSIISERIIKPLEAKGIVEQEGRPTEDGARREKKFVRIKSDVDPRQFHELIRQSALFMINKYRVQKKRSMEQKKNLKRGVKKDAADIYEKMYYESARELLKLEKLEEERQQEEESEDENEYWARRFQIYHSEPWHKLLEAERIVYNTLKPRCKRCREAHDICKDDCYPLKRPGVSFTIATMLNKELCDEIDQRQRDEAIAHGVQYVPMTGQSGYHEQIRRELNRINGVDKTP
jgi:hypothetical protein